ncbi:RNA recognition motif domain-containing protein [Aspergillus vadensis CBS 113365]|uniref:RRM domain-containing protein n=1 Tax=Aspergillus vadensis (strain CBS 113365 / IMI 142717 / IBT 24658) TaxID=1448311 RepID=A0A319CXQ5_ASPVC|nr:hypothetical protein BO88DRAFT_411760 [Aspergillus vadensis CBS 113365]PYH72862.1 hypothetical protein BO88DRAFT_411760 [Aspergillus vadensis CBS 113365]
MNFCQQYPNAIPYPRKKPFGPAFLHNGMKWVFFTGARMQVEGQPPHWMYIDLPSCCDPEMSFYLPEVPLEPQWNVIMTENDIPDGDPFISQISDGVQDQQYIIPASNLPSMPPNRQFARMTHPGFQVGRDTPLYQMLRQLVPTVTNSPPQPSPDGSDQAQAGSSQGSVANGRREPEQPDTQSREPSPLQNGSGIENDILIAGGLKVTDDNAQDLLPREARLFIGNLPSALDPPQTVFELKRMLGEYGRCYVIVKTNPNSGLRTAFVQFETPEVAKRVSQMRNGQESVFKLQQRTLRFEMAKGRRSTLIGTHSSEAPLPVQRPTQEAIEGIFEPTHEMNGEGHAEPAHEMNGDASGEPAMNGEGSIEHANDMNGESTVELLEDNTGAILESSEPADESNERFYNAHASGTRSAPCLSPSWGVHVIAEEQRLDDFML